MRSRSPTLRKTETQDMYRTYVECPDLAGSGAVIFSNEQVPINAEDGTLIQVNEV